MLLFAHTGITLGLTYVWERLPLNYSEASTGKPGFSKLKLLQQNIDYRLVLIGSMLPDIIDKPLGHVLYPDTFNNNGRIIAHTLLFFILTLSYGLFRLYAYNKTGVLVLSLSSGWHLILDGMWYTHETLLWPMFGWSFPATEYTDIKEWLSEIGKAAHSEPVFYLTELAGFIILLLVSYTIFKNKRLTTFITKGRI
jgi:hypothetical protein